jgi:hypothetical protein
MDRREFAALAALGLVEVPVAEAGGNVEAMADEDTALPRLGEAQYQAVLARCGKHLDEADRKLLRARLARASLGGLAESLKLDWRDEPAFVYSATVEE